MSDLTETQRATLSSLADLTNGGDERAMISVLESADWDLQRAASLIFDHGASITTPAPAPRPVRQEFEVDDASQNNVPQQHPMSLTAYVSYPLNLVTSLLRFILRFLPFRFLPFAFARLWAGATPKSNQSLEDWVRGLEEELRTSTVSNHQAETSAFEPSTSAAGLTQRARQDPLQRLLPDFESQLTYEAFLRKCIDDAKIGCAILLSEESDNAQPFKRDTLSNPTLVRAFRRYDILVWAGPTHLLEPYKASLKLSCTTYPFIAFMGLQPRRSSTHSQSNSQDGSLTILSRLEGYEKTSADQIVNHIENTVVPRVTPHLLTVRHQREEAATRRLLEQETRAAERRLRAEQDVAYMRAAQKDKERIEKKRQEVEEARHRAQQEEEQNAIEMERMTHEVSRRIGWRVWEMHHFGESSASNYTEGGVKPLRVVLRMPSVPGKVWMLPPSMSLTSLYARIDSLLASSALEVSAIVPPFVETEAEAQRVLESHMNSLATPSAFFPFSIHLAYPRVPIAWSPATTLGDIEELRKSGGGAIVVEMTGGSSRASLDGSRKSIETNGSGGNSVDSDGYESEE